jgi:hypothetical protein
MKLGRGKKENKRVALAVEEQLGPTSKGAGGSKHTLHLRMVKRLKTANPHANVLP